MESAQRIDLIDEWTAAQLREFLDRHHPDDFQLIDVRSAAAFARKHLPGALSIAAEELPLRHAALDLQKTTILYCDQGALSHVAASLLVRAGFADLHVLNGGLESWCGGTASGTPHKLYVQLTASDDPQEQAVLAWSMEESAHRFYRHLAKTLPDPDAAALFARLAEVESQHMATLKAVWEALTGRVAAADFPADLLTIDNIMEGGARLNETLQWATKSTPAQVIDFAMAMELCAYDHYLTLQRVAKHPDSRRLFEVMADEERHHLRELGQVLETQPVTV